MERREAGARTVSENPCDGRRSGDGSEDALAHMRADGAADRAEGSDAWPGYGLARASEGADDGDRSYEVIVARRALDVIASIGSKADAAAVSRAIDLLDTVPWIGRSYDPLYEAARPDFDLLVVYAGHFGIYYQVDDEGLRVYVLFVEDQRADPLRRFS